MTGTPAGRRSPTWPSAASTIVGVIGDPIAHSLSPLLHNAAFDALGLDWVSVAFAVAEGRVTDALAGIRALGLAGLSVTMPHKQAAAAAVDECSPVAERLGAVNCVVARDGRLVGESTDGPGFLSSLRRGSGFDPAGRRCVVVGAGGAARAIVLALAGAGAGEVVVVNRTPGRAAQAADLAGEVGRVGTVEDVAHADLVVQATPVGMAGTARTAEPPTDQPPPTASLIDAELLHRGQLVADVVYHPAVTPLLAAARTRGADTLGGLGMLVHQAAYAIELWTRHDAPVEAMWAAVGGDPSPTGG